MACLEFLSKMPGKPGKCLEFQSDCSVHILIMQFNKDMLNEVSDKKGKKHGKNQKP